MTNEEYAELKKKNKEDLVSEVTYRGREIERLSTELAELKEKVQLNKKRNKSRSEVLVGSSVVGLILCFIFGLEHLFKPFTIVSLVLIGFILINGYMGIFFRD